MKRNDYQTNEVEGRSDNSLEATVEEYIKTHDVTFKLPIVGSTLTFAGRNLDQNEVDLKVNFNDGSQVEGKNLHFLNMKLRKNSFSS